MIIQLNNRAHLVGDREGPAWTYIGGVDSVQDAGHVEYGAWWEAGDDSPWRTRDVHTYGLIPQDGTQTAFGDMHIITLLDGTQRWLWVNTDQVYLLDDRGNTITRLRTGDGFILDLQTHQVLTGEDTPVEAQTRAVRANLLWQAPTQGASGMGFTGRLTYRDGRPVF